MISIEKPVTKKLLFIYNFHAGKTEIKNKVSDIVDLFVKHEYDITIYPTQHPQDASRKIKECGDNYDLIVCAGGDGTLNEVVTGVMELKKDIPIGYIPTGSTNDFSVSIGIPTNNMLKAAEVAIGDNIFSTDIGTLNDKYFVYIAAFGLFTEVSYKTDQNLKNTLGHSAYILEGIKNLGNIPSYKMRIESDERKIEGEYIYGMVTNSISVGGFKNITGKNIKLDDGLYEVTLVRTPQNLLQFSEILVGLLNGQMDSSNIEKFKTSNLTIESEEEIPWTTDGEFGGKYKKVKIINNKNAIKIHIL